MIEVEVKAKIDNFEDMRKKLNDLGAIKTKEEFQEDIYFNSPIVDFAKTDEALRIRTTKQGDEKHIFIKNYVTALSIVKPLIFAFIL